MKLSAKTLRAERKHNINLRSCGAVGSTLLRALLLLGAIPPTYRRLAHNRFERFSLSPKRRTKKRLLALSDNAGKCTRGIHKNFDKNLSRPTRGRLEVDDLAPSSGGRISLFSYFKIPGIPLQLTSDS